MVRVRGRTTHRVCLHPAPHPRQLPRAEPARGHATGRARAGRYRCGVWRLQRPVCRTSPPLSVAATPTAACVPSLEAFRAPDSRSVTLLAWRLKAGVARGSMARVQSNTPPYGFPTAFFRTMAQAQSLGPHLSAPQPHSHYPRSRPSRSQPLTELRQPPTPPPPTCAPHKPIPTSHPETIRPRPT